MTFDELLRRARGEEYEPPETLLALDPGETTGVAVFREGRLDDAEHLEMYDKSTKTFNWMGLIDLFERVRPTRVVCENYRVYQHKLSTHTNSEVLTVRIIGAIDMLCAMEKVPRHYQMASMAKGFCTDAKLKEWGYWLRGMRHSRDAIRHGCYYLLFHRGDRDG